MSRTEASQDEVQALARLDLQGLRAVWLERYGAPPKLRSQGLLRRMLAWKLQSGSAAAGRAGLALALRQSPRATATSVPGVGTRLTREWKGVAHTVEVAENGFVHQGVTYRSLSKVAMAITGVKWNGPRFFGLRADG